MKKQLDGLDLLRGIGIFGVVTLHGAFYHFGGLYGLDLSNPPPAVTVIGFLLMFAGLFGILSGLVHGLSYHRRAALPGFDPVRALKRGLVAGAFFLVVAYAYFLLTGPGLVHLSEGFMDESIFVHFIRTGILAAPSLDRLLYVDSLVMIGCNLVLLSLYQYAETKLAPRVPAGLRAHLPLFAALVVFLLSLLRLPLYSVYVDAVASGNTVSTLALNWLVNKNNPILPYFAFGLFGTWCAALLASSGGFVRFRRFVAPMGVLFLVVGVALYVLLPESMLERSIDAQWYAIMTLQVGLFLLVVLAFLRTADFHRDGSEKTTRTPMAFLSRYLTRFGVAGLTVFFVESLVSEAVFGLIRRIDPNFSLDLAGAVLFGFCLAVLWGFVLMLWQRSGYRFGIEYAYTRAVKPFGGSQKARKLAGGKE
jgi:hypothetical protein